jgi:hypothetical protein
MSRLMRKCSWNRVKKKYERQIRGSGR